MPSTIKHCPRCKEKIIKSSGEIKCRLHYAALDLLKCCKTALKMSLDTDRFLSGFGTARKSTVTLALEEAIRKTQKRMIQITHRIRKEAQP
jgi:hypothetical protein